jgi:hypothetical protein
MAYDDNDNDGRFPDDSRVEVRYPRTRQEEHGDRAAWPWLPGSIVEQCGPDEWRVCVEDRGVAVLRDGRPAPRNTASRNLYYPMCFRDSSEIRRPAPAVPKPSMPALRVDATPAVRRPTAPGSAQGAVAVTGDPMTGGAATLMLCVVAGSAVTTDLPAPDAASGSHHPPLNYYGELARRQWECCLPDAYQQIRDLGAFFAVLGEVIAHRIDEVADYLAGDDQHGEGYLAKVARLTAARDHAQEQVLAEYLLLPPDEVRPTVVDRGHPSWAEVDAEQRERLGDPPDEDGRL